METKERTQQQKSPGYDCSCNVKIPLHDQFKLKADMKTWQLTGFEDKHQSSTVVQKNLKSDKYGHIILQVPHKPQKNTCGLDMIQV